MTFSITLALSSADETGSAEWLPDIEGRRSQDFSHVEPYRTPHRAEMKDILSRLAFLSTTSKRFSSYKQSMTICYIDAGETR
ncbi:hypothetical protein NPIL_92051 [Nephila pilipes]|uniref:Uncharacterized protein n=1 Tax=Nephila pilipes TaxID=299642 RepID=A0A8X6P7U8_NEPPI|nr:hypothetical protein NPIL_92051 [Nephila pilipes]